MNIDKKQEGELFIVTEVGTFGDLNIKDPTKKKVLKKNEIDDVIAEAVKENAANLSK